MGEIGARRRTLRRATRGGENQPGGGSPDRNSDPEASGGATPDRPRRWAAWLDAPVSRWWCIVGWFVATLVFLTLALGTGGPGSVDAQESMYSTWAIAHGDFGCAFPLVTPPHEPEIAPVYPLVSGAVAALEGIGHTVPFPSRAAMGPQCDRADATMLHWADRAVAIEPTRAIDFTGWLVLLAGIVAWLRAAGRGRRRWEPATLLVVACLPVVWLCVSFYVHPQDLYALGLGLGAMACARRGSWGWAGALAALAVLSQQYALLVAAPLLVLVPAGRRWRYAGAAVATGALLVVPLVVATHGGVVRAITLGSGDNPSFGGTAMWELSHRGGVVVLGSRLLPVALSMLLAWWAVRRLGQLATSATVMISLVAVSLSLRLVLEQNLFAYYFMALTVALILLEVTRGHVRGSTVAWLASVLMVFTLDAYYLRIISGLPLYHVLPPLVLGSALALTVVSMVRRRPWSWWQRLLGAGVVACALISWTRPSGAVAVPLPIWVLQSAFALSGMLVALTPLLEEVRRRPEPEPDAVPTPPEPSPRVLALASANA